MSRKSAISTVGYAIVSVIVFGVVMIISAPMFVNNIKGEKTKSKRNLYELQAPEALSRLNELETRLSERIDNLEQRQQDLSQQSNAVNRYVCKIEGSVDEAGNLVPIDSPNKTEKIVFVCEYKM